MYGSIRKDGVANGSSLLVEQREDRTIKSTPDDYLYSLLHPLNLSVAPRIPDFNGHPVSSFTDQIETTIQIESAASAGQVHGFTVYFQNGSLFVITEATTSSSANSPYGATSVVTMGVGTDANIATYSMARLVSAGFQMEFLGNDSVNSGLVTVAYLSKPEMNAAGATVANALKTTQTSLQNARNTWSGAYKNGLTARYVPMDPDDMIFGNLSTVAAMLHDTPISKAVQRCAIQVHITANQQTNVRITAVAHYEGLAKDDSQSYGPTLYSKNDPFKLAKALDFSQRVPFATPLIGQPGTGLQLASPGRIRSLSSGAMPMDVETTPRGRGTKRTKGGSPIYLGGYI